MTFDLARDEIEQRQQSLPSTKQSVTEAGWFDGFWRGTGMAAMRTFAQAGRALDLAAAAPALGFAQLTGRYDAIDRFFKDREDFGPQRAIDYWTPKPGEVGVAGEVIGTLLATLPLVIANPAAAIAQFGLSQGQDVVKQGASARQGAGVATVMGGGFGLGVWLPMLGGTLAQRVGIGAGANVAQGIAMRGAAGKIVEGTPAADMFHAFDPQEITIDVLMGLAFGGLAHALPSWRAQSDASNKAFIEGYAKIKDWAQNLKPSDIEALATLRMAQHKNADSLPGTPVGPEDVDAHVARVNRALEQVTADEPVHVDDLPPARVEPFLAREQYDGTHRDGTAWEATYDTVERTDGTHALVRTTRDADGERIEHLTMDGTWQRGLPAKTSVSMGRGVEQEQGPETYPSREAALAAAAEDAGGMGGTKRAAGIDPRVEEANAQLRMLEEVADTEAVAAGLPPREIPFEQRPAYQAVRQALETLDQAGKFGPEYVDAAAKIADAFLTAAARRTGKPIEEIIKRYLPTLTNKPPEGAALEQVTKTPAFKRWFGDSKVVDEKGEPLVVYHGTADDVTAFDLDHPHRKDTGWLGTGVYMTTSADLAGSYSNMKGGSEDPNVMPLYARIENPYYATQRDKERFMLISHNKGREAGREAADAWTQELKAKGHDGVILDYTADKVGAANVSKEIVVFDPAGVKSAVGNRGTFDPADPNILRQDQQAPTFYSELGRQIEAAKMKAAPAKGWMDFIRGLQQKGVKAEEVKWSGIEEWLDVQGRQFRVDDYIEELNAKYGTKTEGVVTTPGWTKADLKPEERAHLEKLASEPDNQGRVTKEQVQAFLEQGGVRVEEVMLGETGSPQAELLARIDVMNEQELRRFYEEQVGYDPMADDLTMPLEGPHGLRGLARGIVEENEHTPLVGGTKFGIYQLPGGQNYRELLLTLPGKESGASAEALDPLIRSLSHWPNDPHTARDPARQAELDELNAEWERRDRANIDRGQRFTESHWEQPNVLAHVRFNERTDADGKRVLFVEEIQSDWAQKGKKQGFAVTPAREAELRAKIAEIEALGREATSEQKQEWADAMTELQPERTRIPAAPFVTKTDSWTALVVKRMIHYAATNGFDRVAWTRGEQQVERYTNALRQAVDAIEWKKTDKGIQITGYKSEETRGGGVSFAERSRLEEAAHDARRLAIQSIERNENVGFDTAADALDAIWGHRADWVTRWGDMPQPDIEAIETWIYRRNEYARAEGTLKTRRKVVDTTEKEDALSDAVGKAMAEKIINDPAQEGVIEGEGIRVDDTGMAGYYDRIVPKVVNDVLKKLGGGKVGTTKLDIQPESNLTRGFIYEGPALTRGDLVQRIVDGDNGYGPTAWPVEVVRQAREVARAMGERGLTFEDAIQREGSPMLAEKLGGQMNTDMRPLPPSEQHGFDITPELRERAKQGMPLFQKGPENQPRGYFQMGADGPKIGLLEHADRSTFLHESGHFFLEVTNDLARAPDAPAELKADMQTLLDWFKVDAAKWEGMTLDQKRPYHEQFARGIERYVAEGKAPVPELQGVFDRFKAWLLDIYQSLRGLNVKLSDDVRGVMDRMLGAATVAPEVPKPTMPHRVSLIDDIMELGGIRKDALQDITGESRTGKRVKGIPPGLFKEDGAGLDDLATLLRDNGWPIPEDDVDGGVQGLRDLIAKELGGETTLKLDEDPNVLKPLAEQDAAAVFDRYAQLEAKAAEAHDFSDSADYRAEIQRLRTQRDYELASVLSGEGLHLEAEARRISAEHPDLEIVIGNDADGEPIRQSARDMLDQAEAEAKAIEDQEPLMIEAAECIAGTG